MSESVGNGMGYFDVAYIFLMICVLSFFLLLLFSLRMTQSNVPELPPIQSPYDMFKPKRMPIIVYLQDYIKRYIE